MVTPRNYSTLSSIFLVLTLLLALVKSYDCGKLETIDRKCPMVPGPVASYPNCLVTKFSVSAFIQCADVKGPDAPQFGTVKKGKSGIVGALELLNDALDTIPCSYCPLAGNIRKAAAGKGLGDFATYFCNQFHPLDTGICCLRQCLNGVEQEHSIEAFCNGKVNDLMNAPPVLQNCVSNAVSDGSTHDGSGVSDNDNGSRNEGSGSGTGTGNGGSDSDTDSDDSSATTSSSDKDTSTSTTAKSSVNNTPSTTSSTISTPSLAAQTDTRSTSSPPQVAQGTPNVGADTGRRATYIDRVKRLGFAVLPIVAAF